MSKRDRNRTGIEYEPRDKTQNWRVYFQGHIVWFARTKEEAEAKLAETKLKP